MARQRVTWWLLRTIEVLLLPKHSALCNSKHKNQWPIKVDADDTTKHLFLDPPWQLSWPRLIFSSFGYTKVRRWFTIYLYYLHPDVGLQREDVRLSSHFRNFLLYEPWKVSSEENMSQILLFENCIKLFYLQQNQH